MSGFASQAATLFANAVYVGYLKPRLKMMRYREWISQDLVIASGQVEGAVRHVVGERMDCAGVRWIPQRAEALLHLRCIGPGAKGKMYR